MIALVLATGIVSCGGSDNDDARQREGDGGRKYGGTYTMNVLRGSPNGLDPVLINSKHADDIASQIYDKLIDLNEDLVIVPELSRNVPEISSDGKRYLFHLRTDVRFQDNPCFPDGKGRLVNAYDVKYSLTRCCDPRTRTLAYWAFQNKVRGATEYFEAINRGEMPDGIDGFRIVNDSTFEIELLEAYSPFIYYLVNSLGSVVPSEAITKYGENFFRSPVGSGPFMFETWSQDQELVLKRNPNYWGKDERGNRLPFLDRLRFLFMTDDKSQFNEFLAGNLDESFNLPTERFEDVFDAATGKGKPEFAQYQLQTAPAMLTWFCDFLTTRPPFDNADVRRAFNYAIDREKIVRFVLKGSPLAPAEHGIVPPAIEGYPVESIPGYTFDPARAKELLAKAGYPGGKGFPVVTLHIYPEPRLQQVAVAMQEMIRQTLGISLELMTIEFPQLISQSETGKLAFWGTRWYGDYPDAETFLNLFNGAIVPQSDTLPSYPNSTRYRSAEFDKPFQAGVRTIDNVARTKYYVEAERIAIADAPVIPLFYERHFRLLQPWVHGVALDAMARYDLKFAWVDREDG